MLRDGFVNAHHVDRWARERTSARGGRDDDRAAGVGHQAAVALAQRIGNHLGSHDFFDRGFLAPVGLGIELRPFSRRYRHFGQVLVGGAVALHVQLRHHRVVADGTQLPIGRDELPARHAHVLRRTAHLARSVRQLGAAVGHQRHLAHTGLDRGHGVADVHDAGHAAHAG
ncbi:hypothetical protein G6F22_019236 [Rhizopus arrhizus]|nr:hypothetical protein G6F22_019236 [Rhizopus arrhizus]